MSKPIPVIICGQRAMIAASVKNGLEPEYETIHIILTLEAGIAEIPLLVQRESLPKSDNIGTQNYQKPPAAVIIGGGYDDESFEKMKKACEGKGNVLWLRSDLTTAMPPLGLEYGKVMVGRVKACMKKLVEEGKMGGDGVYLY